MVEVDALKVRTHLLEPEIRHGDGVLLVPSYLRRYPWTISDQ
jgi:hypothetical protein